MRCALVLAALAAVCAVTLLLLVTTATSPPLEVGDAGQEEPETLPAGGDSRNYAPKEPNAPAQIHRSQQEDAPARLSGAEHRRSTVTTEHIVVDRSTGRPVAGALVRVRIAVQPCDERFEAADVWSSDEGGRVALDVPVDGRPRDVYAQAEGYQPMLLCAVLLTAPLRIELERGLQIVGVVLSATGDPVEGAAISALASESESARPRATHRTGADGHFVLRDLGPGHYTVRVDAANHRTATVGPTEAGGEALTIRLQPGLGVTFRIRPLDAQVPEAPTVAWSVDVRGAPGGVELLRAGLDPASGEWVARITLPAGGSAAAFEVKAIGYGAWRSGRVDTPASGGELEFVVPLDRDQSGGRLVIRLEQRTGEPISATDANVEVRLARSDGQAVAAGVVYYVREVVDYPSLPAGSYRVTVRAPALAPATADAIEVRAGQTVETRLATGPAASVHIRFVGPDRAMIEFQIWSDGTPALPYCAQAGDGPAPSTASTQEEPTQSVNTGGATFTGLGAGPHRVVVVSKEWQAEEASIHLREGETTSVEVAVRHR